MTSKLKPDGGIGVNQVRGGVGEQVKYSRQREHHVWSLEVRKRGIQETGSPERQVTE